MSRRVFLSVGAALLVGFSAFGSAISSGARSVKVPTFAGSPDDLINAVNALRVSFGLAPYSINSILMSTAQGQADFMASTSSMTHSGPGGIGLTARLLAAGYPLAGDLSLGGFRAENITGGNEDMPAETAVDQWTGDALHLSTMVSQSLTEIGAGVAISNGRVYYVIDAARPTTAGELLAVTTAVNGSSPVTDMAQPELIIPVSISTPNSEGNIFHDVKFGQTLWQIAFTYNVKIDDIRRLNNLTNNNIYPGSSLLIKQGFAVPTGSPTESPAKVATSTIISTLTQVGGNAMVTSLPGTVPGSSLSNNTTVMTVMIGIIVVALIGGAVFTWIGNSSKR